MFFDDCIVYRKISDTPSGLANEVQAIIKTFRNSKNIVKIDVQYVYGNYEYTAFITVFFGRVQTPTLAMIVKRDNEVNNFVKCREKRTYDVPSA